jgi:hypothetical protein
MERRPIFYTLKVWLWSVVISPVIAGLIQFYFSDGKMADMGSVMLYPIILVFEVLLTFLLWVLFWALTAICNNFIKNDAGFRLAASLVGLAIAAVLCWGFGEDVGYSLEDIIFNTALANCLCIFAGCWYFNIRRPIADTHPSTINTNPYEQATE